MRTSGHDLAIAPLAAALVLSGCGRTSIKVDVIDLHAAISGQGVCDRPCTFQGDSADSGTATVGIVRTTRNPGDDEASVCVKLSLERLRGASVKGALRRGASGQDGPVLASLPSPDADGKFACVPIDPNLAVEIKNAPASFYVAFARPLVPQVVYRGQLAYVLP